VEEELGGRPGSVGQALDAAGQGGLQVGRWKEVEGESWSRCQL
jgi:hypothetical protein